MKSAQQHWQWWHFMMLSVIVLLALAPCDLPIARLCYSNPPPGPAVEFLKTVAEFGGGGAGVCLVLVALALFGGAEWNRMPRMLSASLGAGLIADVAKLYVHRGRPHALDLSAETFVSTFRSHVPLFSVGSKWQSFPSGHVTTAVGFAIVLSMLYPRRAWFFASLALTTAISRVIVHAHFPTDVCAGAILGGVWAYACHCGFAAPAFDWCERMIDEKISLRGSGSNATAAVRVEQEVPAGRSPLGIKDKSEYRDAA
jgi:membrane-associated phospholipid phosphatase